MAASPEGINNKKYLYCLIESPGGEEVFLPMQEEMEGTIDLLTYRDIAAVVSEAPFNPVRITEENCLAHERVLLEVMRHFTVVPFQFGTVSPHANSVKGLLKENYTRIKRALKDLKQKSEFTVNAYWINMKAVFSEILKEHPKIARFKDEIKKRPQEDTYKKRIVIGQMVAEAIDEKKKMLGDKILTPLKRSCPDYLLQGLCGDAMVFHAAFLVSNSQKETFEAGLYELGKAMEGSVDFAYMGPLPPYHFVNLRLEI